ncbi:MAG: hypothetical protein AVDCRST_MAG11-2259, partial [uncultured Gemmatimonadaceae bacterium]
ERPHIVPPPRSRGGRRGRRHRRRRLLRGARRRQPEQRARGSARQRRVGRAAGQRRARQPHAHAGEHRGPVRRGHGRAGLDRLARGVARARGGRDREPEQRVHRRRVPLRGRGALPRRRDDRSAREVPRRQRRPRRGHADARARCALERLPVHGDRLRHDRGHVRRLPGGLHAAAGRARGGGSEHGAALRHRGGVPGPRAPLRRERRVALPGARDPRAHEARARRVGARQPEGLAAPGQPVREQRGRERRRARGARGAGGRRPVPGERAGGERGRHAAGVLRGERAQRDAGGHRVPEPPRPHRRRGGPRARAPRHRLPDVAAAGERVPDVQPRAAADPRRGGAQRGEHRGVHDADQRPPRARQQARVHGAGRRRRAAAPRADGEPVDAAATPLGSLPVRRAGGRVARRSQLPVGRLHPRPVLPDSGDRAAVEPVPGDPAGDGVRRL